MRRGGWFALLALGGVATPLSAQHVVEGRIVSAHDGGPIADASIEVVGVPVEVAVDSLGRFRFEVPETTPGIGIRVEAPEFRAQARSWLLPLDGPITIGLERFVYELDPLAVEVDFEPKRAWTSRPLEWQFEFRVRRLMGTERTATAADLREFGDQMADVWDFLPALTIATGTGCEECIMMGGRSRPRFFMDDKRMELDQFRMWRVEEICRVDAVRLRGGSSMILAYTCDFIRDLATGRRTLSPFIGMSKGGDA